MIRDSFGRLVNNLRISITQRCMFDCFFCHREGADYESDVEMKAEEIERIVKVAFPPGSEVKVKLTGGEPLLRDDVTEIVYRLSRIPQVKEVALTTNGVLLSELAKPLKKNGLKRVNVTLNSLKTNVYRTITGTGLIREAVAGIRAAIDADLRPIKVNMVILKGLNEDQIWDMVNFTRENNLVLQLIEFESRDEENEDYQKYHSDLSRIETELMKKGEKMSIRSMQKRRKYFLRGGGEVEVVRPMHNTEFCSHCSRLRISSDGKFKPCLFRSNNSVDFLTPMRQGATDEELRALFIEAVNRRKPYFT